MDLEDEGWVNIPYDGLLEVHDDGGEKSFSRKYVKSPVNLFKPNYFETPQKCRNFVQEEPRFGKQLVPLPTQFDHEDHEVKEMIKLPILITNEPKEARNELELDHDPVFQVFFNIENQFVDKKTGSLRLNPREPDLSCIETGQFQYEKRSTNDDDDCSSPSKMIKKEVVDWGSRSEERLNFWRWGLSGFGAFCCVGMAAATIGILIFGNGRKQNQKLRIQFYSDNKGMKQVVHHANEAISSAVRGGVPLVKAQITYGGYYETL
ncbi:hypothetical protein OSB04_009483 [Centaurea solstitialis]|uniref:DUF6821 domain-containing protein n=1 Tax=Centaurea solstitialis TaxID=347529 RepID=A0AA38WM64_9ASTR|nr:hypothetical protein OSB04_009483 [Centaurea solstitialis]